MQPRPGTCISVRRRHRRVPGCTECVAIMQRGLLYGVTAETCSTCDQYHTLIDAHMPPRRNAYFTASSSSSYFQNPNLSAKLLGSVGGRYAFQRLRFLDIFRF